MHYSIRGHCRSDGRTSAGTLVPTRRGGGGKGYMDFCTLIDSPPIPPTALTIMRGSALFPAGRTFGMYVRHAEKARARHTRDGRIMANPDRPGGYSRREQRPGSAL